MTCSQAQRWLQEYLDGRLELSHLASLQRHLHGCPTCRSDLVLFEVLREALDDETLALSPGKAEMGGIAATAAPMKVPDLAPLVLQRIARTEAARAAAKERAQATWHERRWQGGVLLLAMVVLAWLILPGGGDGYNRGLSHALTSASSVLMTPGPESIAWLAWIAGAAAVLALLVSVLRAESATEWRRAVSQRLPQLW